MSWLLSLGVHNAVVVMFLALVALGVTRIWKNPPLAHWMWLLVLLKLVTPPLVNLDLGGWNRESPNPVGLSPGAADFLASQPIARGPRTPNSGEPRAEAELSRAREENPNSVASDDRRSVFPAGPRSTLAGVWSVTHSGLMWIWVGGAALFALLAGIRIIRFQRLLAGLLPASEPLQSVASDLANRMGLRQAPDTRVAQSAVAPLVWCVGGRATIVLPLRLLAALDKDQTAMVLAHELAHLRRRDHWVRVLELAVSILYWWHPLVWWIRRQLHAAEEQCCDAWVAWVFPDRSHDYAQSLLKAAELVPAPTPRLALASPFLNTHTLKERIEMVLTNRAPREASRLALVTFVLLAAVVIPAGVRGVAEARDKQPPAVPVAARQPAGKKPAGKVPTAATPRAQNDKSEQPVARSEQPIAKELKLLQGTFNVSKWWRSDKWPAKPEEFQAWRWTIKGQEIVWTRPQQEDLRLSFTVDATASPRQIDLTFLNGPDKGEKCLGIYFPSRHEIDVSFQEPGAKVDRPKNSGTLAGEQRTSLTLVPAETLPVADEVAALQGTWKFDIYYSDWWPERISNPPISWSRWRWTIKGNEIHWSGMKVPDVKLSFTVDPAKSPRQIDLTFLDGPHKGKKLLGMYQFFAEDACYICFADPEAKVKRPTDVAYSRDLGQTMVSIEKVAEEKPAAVATSPAKEKAADRGLEIDAAIARLRKQGAMVREFHPRGDPEYWVQIVSNAFVDEDLQDVEIIARGVPLYFHLNKSSVTPAGLERLASASRIGQLELSGDNIDDTLVKSLPKLPLQGQLGLYGERLTNAGIEPVSKCLQLTSISLGGNLGNDSLEHLTGLPKLQRVSLGKHFTRGAFDVLARLAGLTNLDASELDPDLDDLKKLPKLQTLSLMGRKYDDEAARTIADTFTSLDSAYLRFTSITNAGVQHLSRLKNLKILTLDDSLVDDGMADSIRKMKQLTWLSVGDCAVGDDTVAALSECPEMWYVFLVHTRVSDKGLAHLPKLKKPLALYLSECKSVTDTSVKSLAQLPDSPNLHINLQNSGITEKGARELQAALPHAQISWGIPPVKLK